MENGCWNCAGSGWFASALTNWDAVRCEDCKGTGVIAGAEDAA